MTDADAERQDRHRPDRQSTTEALPICGCTSQIAATGSRITIFIATANHSTLHSKYASVPEDTEHNGGRGVQGTRRKEKEWEWTGEKGSKRARKHPRTKHHGHPSPTLRSTFSTRSHKVRAINLHQSFQLTPKKSDGTCG